MGVDISDVILVSLFLPNITTILIIILFLVMKSKFQCNCKAKEKSNALPVPVEEKQMAKITEINFAKEDYRYSRSNSERTSNRSSEAALLSKERRRSSKERTISDVVSKWCDRNHLTEATANELRQKGFQNETELNALTYQFVETLNLTNGQKCLLQKVVSCNNGGTDGYGGNTNTISSTYTSVNCKNNGNPRSTYNKKASTKDMSFNSNSTATTIGLDRSHSVDELENSSYPLLQQNSSSPLSPQPNIYFANFRQFHGLLSDQGLYALGEKIGREWRRIATNLKVSQSMQDQYNIMHQNNICEGITRMLKTWRDTTPGSKEEIRAILVDALKKSKRQDLADVIMTEVVNGSQEKVPDYTSII